MARKSSLRTRVFLTLAASAAAAFTVYSFAAPFDMPH
jgi:hypothetical protein